MLLTATPDTSAATTIATATATTAIAIAIAATVFVLIHHVDDQRRDLAENAKSANVQRGPFDLESISRLQMKGSPLWTFADFAFSAGSPL